MRINKKNKVTNKKKYKKIGKKTYNKKKNKINKRKKSIKKGGYWNISDAQKYYEDPLGGKDFFEWVGQLNNSGEMIPIITKGLKHIKDIVYVYTFNSSFPESWKGTIFDRTLEYLQTKIQTGGNVFPPLAGHNYIPSNFLRDFIKSNFDVDVYDSDKTYTQGDEVDYRIPENGKWISSVIQSGSEINIVNDNSGGSDPVTLEDGRRYIPRSLYEIVFDDKKIKKMESKPENLRPKHTQEETDNIEAKYERLSRNYIRQFQNMYNILQRSPRQSQNMYNILRRRPSPSPTSSLEQRIEKGFSEKKLNFNYNGDPQEFANDLVNMQIEIGYFHRKGDFPLPKRLSAIGKPILPER